MARRINSIQRTGGPFAFPASIRPGVDQSHIGAKGACSFSVVAHLTGGAFDLTSMKLGTATVTAPTFKMDSILGPCAKFPGTASNTLQFSGKPATADATSTLAAIFRITTINGSNVGNAIVSSGGSSNDGVYFWMESGGSIALSHAGVGTVVGSQALNVGVPYFVACSFSSNKQNVNIIIVNLATGATRQQAVSDTNVSNASNGTNSWGGENWSGTNDINGVIAAGMYSRTYLSAAELALWGSDPWSFWYPGPSILDNIQWLGPTDSLIPYQSIRWM